jgi:hypothetical protein
MKKKLLAFCLAVGTVLSINAQEKKKISESEVPAAIQTTFKGQYPNAADAEWKLKEGKYKVHFEVDGTKQMAAFDQSGTLLSKGVQVKEADLPTAIGTSTKSMYANREIDEIYKIDKNGTTNYLVKLKGDPDTKVLYSADGQVIKDKSDW